LIRKAFVMSVHPGREVKYEARHSSIWPELEAMLKEHGVHTYTTFLHPGIRQLFAYVEYEDQAGGIPSPKQLCVGGGGST
jgi:L-rhamnose mutarotase